MKLQTSILALNSLIITTQAVVITPQFRNPVVETFIPEWEVEEFPGGPWHIVNGTVQQVRRHMLTLNPRWDDHYLNNKNNTPTDDQDTLSKRDQHRFRYPATATINCDVPLRRARLSPILDGIKYLRGLPGRPRNGPKREFQEECGRVSCDLDAAIWWCNLTPQPKTLESWGSIADGAEWIADSCRSLIERVVAGEASHNTGWKVRVARLPGCEGNLS